MRGQTIACNESPLMGSRENKSSFIILSKNVGAKRIEFLTLLFKP